MTHTSFGGDKKDGMSILGPIEKRFVTWAVPKVPAWMTSHGLTYTTILWSALIIGCSYLAQWDIRYLWIVSLCIFLQWLTDALDGAVGRFRNSGLVRWGYYMDHFLDYVFLCSILIGYTFFIPDRFNLLFFILVVYGAFMVNSFLRFSATNKFRIAYLGFGPTEARIGFIITNILLIFFGQTNLAFLLPYVLGFALLGLIVVVSRTSKEIWQIDMKNKAQ